MDMQHAKDLDLVLWTINNEGGLRDEAKEQALPFESTKINTLIVELQDDGHIDRSHVYGMDKEFRYSYLYLTKEGKKFFRNSSYTEIFKHKIQQQNITDLEEINLKKSIWIQKRQLYIAFGLVILGALLTEGIRYLTKHEETQSKQPPKLQQSIDSTNNHVEHHE